ncbi:hypothetical protein BD410DRAFT_788364 [Rickenella mellea]|uniref:Uncharacterized protein n=1 Tax=Rickenella mellea TaxID=50990 RepID=A0A4Y7Q569_9AGAM|nr:hypothetical protein BD410DRAFT_788364 [Rickenella mellea]
MISRSGKTTLKACPSALSFFVFSTRLVSDPRTSFHATANSTNRHLWRNLVVLSVVNPQLLIIVVNFTRKKVATLQLSALGLTLFLMSWSNFAPSHPDNGKLPVLHHHWVVNMLSTLEASRCVRDVIFLTFRTCLARIDRHSSYFFISLRKTCGCAFRVDLALR